YLFYSENFSLAKVKAFDKAFTLEIYLQPIPEKTIASNSTSPIINKAKPIILKNVFFDTGSAELRSISFIELDKLYKLLIDNPKLAIQINGHTDNVGADKDNLVLSNGRAKSVYDYLIQKGINPTRLSFKGFGETMPIDTNDTDEGRQNNRRTEFIVVK
ncbi:MAG TPA: OmpA family protein, partial [Saprospiraceae bacterium]|nr:OmpA family protein [Saprospiraceae bacterium]